MHDAHMLLPAADASFALPPAALPTMRAPVQAGPISLRPLTLADNAAAFALSELAFTSDGNTSAAEQTARQARWDDGARQWFGWLHARAMGHAWAAISPDSGEMIGYARVIRDDLHHIEQLTELFIHPAFQGGQVGKALLGAVLLPTVTPGWQRVVIAHPAFPALALYHRWGVFPLGTAWYARIALVPDDQTPQSDAVEEAAHSDTSIASPHAPLLHFMQSALGAQMRQSAAGGYGVRYGAEIGPVVGATPADALNIVRALMADAWAAGQREVGLWAPGANITLLDWLRERRPRWYSHVALMASDPALLTRMDRSLLVAPPYIW